MTELLQIGKLGDKSRRRRGPRVSDQAFGRKYFLTLSPSVLNSTRVPRSCLICFFVRLIMPWRLPRWACSTLPVAVTLKRFLAPDLVFHLGIWLSYCHEETRRNGVFATKMLVRALKVLRFVCQSIGRARTIIATAA